MKYSRYLIVGLMAFVLGGCGQTVTESLKQPLAKKSKVGAEQTIVVLPFADYTHSDNLESAYRRNLFVTENLTDQLTSNSFTLPVQEDVFMYLAKQNIIDVTDYDGGTNSVLADELEGGEWSEAMKAQLKRYDSLSRKRDHNRQSVSSSPGTHGLTTKEVVKIARHFDADYILRGRIIEYKTRKDPSWSPLKKGVLGFVAGITNKLAFGQARSERYDNLGSMIGGGYYGMLYGDWDPKWPFSGRADQTILGVSGGGMSNTLGWGAIGAGLADVAHNAGDVPQAVVQLRIWVQDAYNGDVIWTNRVDVKVSPETVLADYQYDALFEAATEKAIDTLISNFVATKS